MASDNTGASEDLGLVDKDAEDVIGGKTKKKAAAKKHQKQPVSKAVHTTQAGVGLITPRELSRDEKIALNAEAVGDGMSPPYDVPDLPSSDE